jgi:hypothetical protein
MKVINAHLFLDWIKDNSMIDKNGYMQGVGWPSL